LSNLTDLNAFINVAAAADNSTAAAIAFSTPLSPSAFLYPLLPSVTFVTLPRTTQATVN
jgi:hypothetical protein